MKFLIFLALALSSCVTDEPESLDIEVPESSGDQPRTTASQLVAKDEEKINPKSIFEWQNQFKKPPSASNRVKIQENVNNMTKSDDLSIDQLLKVARNQKSLGNLMKSETRYRELLRKDSRNLDAVIELAQLYLMRRQVELAFDYIVNAKAIIKAQEKPSKIDVFKYKYTLALGQIHNQKRDEGHRILSELITSDRKFLLAYIALAGSYLKENKLDMAEFVTKRGLDQSEKNPDLLNLLGIIKSKRGEYRKALSYYNQALEEDENLVPALVNRANLAINKGEFSSAELDLKKAINNNPYHTNSYISLGILYKKTGRYSAAKVTFRKALDLNPESAFARYNLAVLVSDNFNDKNEALRLFYEVLQSNDQTKEIKELAKVQIQGLRDGRLLLEDNKM